MRNVKYNIVNIDGESNYQRQVFTSGDGKYFDRYGEHLLRSINTNSPATKVVLEVINPNPDFEEKIKRLRKELLAIDIITISSRAHFGPNRDSAKPTFYATRRLITLYEYLKTSPLHTLFIDIDCIVRKDLFPMFEYYKDSDMAIYTRLISRELGKKVLAGTIVFNAGNPIVMEFLHKLSSRLKDGQLSWFNDQVQIFHTMFEFKDKMKIADLKKDYIDFDFAEGSTIWTGKGERKDFNEKYTSCCSQIEIDKQIKANICIAQLANADFNWHYLAKLVADAVNSKGNKAEFAVFDNAQQLEEFIKNSEHERIYVPNNLKIDCSRNNLFSYGSDSISGNITEFKLAVNLGDKKVEVQNSYIREITLIKVGLRGALIPTQYIAFGTIPPELGINKEFVSKAILTTLGFKPSFIKALIDKIDPAFFEGKTIALVGNGKSLLESPKGDEIDNHDIVIRFNLGYPYTVMKGVPEDKIPKKYLKSVFSDTRVSPPEKHYLLKDNTPAEIYEDITNIKFTGKKTTIWACATIDQLRQKVYASCFNKSMFLWPHPRSLNNINRKLYTKKLRLLDPAIYWQFKNQGIEPSSGLILFEYLRKLEGVKKVSLYGFDFFSKGHQVRNNDLVLIKKDTFPHSQDFEKNYIMEHIANNPKLSIN